MAIRPSTARRTCSLNELVNWVIFSEVLCSEDMRRTRDATDYQMAREDIEAAFRDGHLQPLGYRNDRSYTRPNAKEIIEKINLDQEDELVPPLPDKAERIPASFWAFADIDWVNSRALSKSAEFLKIHCLMDEVRHNWPAEKIDTPIEKSQDVLPQVVRLPLYGRIGTESLSVENSTESIPASDRIVALDHNSAAYKEAIEALDASIEAITKANDIGDLTAGERSIVLSQLREGRKLFGLPEIKVSAVRAMIEPKLRWVADKAFGTVVGTLALAALGAIGTLLGLTW